MSGHSKWANIKRKKEVVDQKRGSLFTKLSRAITMAAIEGNGPNPDFNAKLRLAIDKAKEANVPKENIDRAIQKGTGPGKEVLSEAVYEAFGLSGSAFLIRVATDNLNRSVSDIRLILEKNKGKLAKPGAVEHLFMRSHEGLYTPLMTVQLANGEEERSMLKLVEFLEADDDVQEVFTNIESSKDEKIPSAKLFVQSRH